MGPLQRFAELVAVQRARVPLDLACLEASAFITGADRAVVVADGLRLLDEQPHGCARRDVDGVLQHLFAPGRFAGNTTDYQDPQNSLLDRVLARRLGIPITLSVVAIEVGRRVGAEIVGVGMPGHFLVRDGSTERYADPFGGPALFGPTECRSIFQRMAPSARWNERHLAVADERAIVIRVLTNLKAIYHRNGDQVALRRVMQLRARIPGLGERESKEFVRMMAPFN